jgi:uncharacterized protein
MSTFKATFSKRHTFLAVVHVENSEQALRNTAIAERGGADGVFLINHSISYLELLAIYREVKNTFDDFWIGLNCLDLGRLAIDVIPKEAQGLWVDNAGISEGDEPTLVAEIFSDKKRKIEWEGIYFGGVAFKYHEEVADVARVALLAQPLVDVITTSGEGTGKAADVAKIHTMKDVIGNHPLAIASGITPENVREYMPYADCFLVATGVSDSHTELNPARVRALAKVLEK